MADSKSFEWTERVVEGKVEKVVAPVVPELADWTETRVVGKPVEREDARLKATGRASYTSDQYPGDVLHAAFLRARVPHAKIASIDVEAARRVPGVRAVLTGRDVKGIAFEDYQVIALEEVRYDGQEVAAVCAISPGAARAALAAIRVEYQALPFAIRTEQVLALNTPLTGNAARFTKGGFGEKPRDQPDLYVVGDAAGGVLNAAARVERTYRTPVQVHAPLETHATVCHWEDEKLIVSESTQGVFAVRETLAEALDVPLNRILVTCPFMGGGFGSKTRAYAHTVLAALFSRQLKRPVRFVLEREDEFRSPFYRPASIQSVRMGADRDGHLTGVVLEALNPVGAHTFMATWGQCQNPYIELHEAPAIKTDNRAVHLNQQPPVAMRGPGNMQAAWGLEQAIDELAVQLKMDPVDLRLKNIPRVNRKLDREYLNHGLAACLNLGREKFGWAKARQRPRDAGPVKRGVGVACGIWDGGGGPPAGALVTIATDGSVRLLTGAADLGTGTRTALAQIVAEELALEAADIQVTNAHTDDTPYTLPSYGSITLASSGPAVRQAAVDARTQLIALAAFLSQSREDQMKLERGRVTGPNGALRIGELAKKMPSKVLVGRGERGANPDKAIKTYGVHFAEVAVDTGTGVITLERLVAVHDSGRVVNPRLWRNQILGGIAMGMGYGLLEERLHDRPTGRLLTDSLAEYTCFAVEGESEHHAILGGGPCHIVHPSDPASALVALGARIHLISPRGPRELALEEIFSGADVTRETVLAPDELVEAVTFAPLAANERSAFLKVGRRADFTFATVNVAAVLRGGSVHLVLGGVAPVPWRARAAEAELAGQRLTAALAQRAAKAALAGAKPLAHNAYKIPLAEALVERALVSMIG